MMKKIEEAKKKFSSADLANNEIEDQIKSAVDLNTYKTSNDFPKDIHHNQVKVDMDKEAIFLPINGRSIPFHVSTIKNISRPDEEKATWMRVNFFIPGSSVKDASKNMQQLVMKYGNEQCFIKEVTLRSLNSQNMTQAYQMFQELRKRIKQRELKSDQEKDLVAQVKLIRIKDQRVPRLQDLTMRPQLSGRKCVGTIEAHQNGLRFTSTKGEILDIMYSNIKHAIYQPCDKTTMVLVHFHLTDFIMIGKKKQKDVQFYTEVIDSSLNLEGSRRSSYDPDELDEEQREKEMRKRLNIAFKEFCLKVEKVANHYGFNLSIDIPFRKSGFEGNCHKEMVFLQPTTHCLVNLTEVPPFVLALSDVDHVHFERVTYATRNFDATFIFKNFSLPPRTITAIEMKYMEIIQDWLNLVEITYTAGPRTMNWVDVMSAARDAGEYFYLDRDRDGEKKALGWLVLSAEDSDEEEEEEDDDESFSSAEVSDDESDEDSSDDDSEYADSDEDDEDEDDEEGDDDDEKGKVKNKLI
jgi:nucleosome binding factor SPN SPT16 subunit